MVPDLTEQYNTQLTPEQEAEFLKQYSPQDSYDYDMRGAFAQGITAAGNGHYPDTFKKPNHPTFSDQSKYRGVDGNEGGHWTELGNGSYAFTPGKSNLETYGVDHLLNYFNKVEPGNILDYKLDE